MALIDTMRVRLVSTVLFAALSALPLACHASAATEKVIYNLGGGTAGDFPQGGLVVTKSGAVFGNTSGGGAGTYGTVFQLLPPAAGKTAWVLKTLHNFTGGNDGGQLDGGLVADGSGALYGMAVQGGQHGGGVVFKMTPPSYAESVIYNFGSVSGDGGFASSTLVIGSDGSLSGTTANGGTSDGGTVFRLKPPAKGSAQWTEQILHSFTGLKDGYSPFAGVVIGGGGALYGATYEGGAQNGGIVFKLAPPAAGKTAWVETILHSFTGLGDGGAPASVLTLVPNGGGALYGTTTVGGLHGVGTVFELSPPAAGKTAWKETVLHSFTGNGDGATPIGPVLAYNGAVYGTTAGGAIQGSCTTITYGGSFSVAFGCGTIYKLTTKPSGGVATFQTLVQFKGSSFLKPSDAAGPASPLTVYGSGTPTLLGSSTSGGTEFGGTIFQLTP